MARFWRKFTTTLVLGHAFVLTAISQTPEPAWLQIERAEMSIATGAHGIAIQLFRGALALDPGNPEAIFGLARAFKAVGDYSEAEGYLLDAVGASSRLIVPAMRFEINYELASLYRVQRKFSVYEELLVATVVLGSEEAARPGSIDVAPDVLQAAFLTRGLDRVLVLYRLEENGGTRARGELAELLVGLGRYDPAAKHGLVAVVQQLSTVIEAIIQRETEFEYQSVLGALSRAEVYPETRLYLSDTPLYRDLYFLGSAIFAGGNSELASTLWSLLSALPKAGRWSERARMQLTDPQREPLLVPLR